MRGQYVDMDLGPKHYLKIWRLMFWLLLLPLLLLLLPLMCLLFLYSFFYVVAQRVGLVMLLPFGVYFTSLVASASTDLEICNFRYHWAEPAYYPDARLRCLVASSGMQMWHVPAQQPQHITSPFACGPARMPAWK